MRRERERSSGDEGKEQKFGETKSSKTSRLHNQVPFTISFTS